MAEKTPISPYALGANVQYATFYTVVHQLIDESHAVPDPIYIDEYPNFPETGYAGVLYIAKDYENHGAYLWNGVSNTYDPIYSGDVYLGELARFPKPGTAFTLYVDTIANKFYFYRNGGYQEIDLHQLEVHSTLESIEAPFQEGVWYAVLNQPDQGVYYWDGVSDSLTHILRSNILVVDFTSKDSPADLIKGTMPFTREDLLYRVTYSFDDNKFTGVFFNTSETVLSGQGWMMIKDDSEHYHLEKHNIEFNLDGSIKEVVVSEQTRSYK